MLICICFCFYSLAISSDTPFTMVNLPICMILMVLYNVVIPSFLGLFLKMMLGLGLEWVVIAVESLVD